MPREAPVIRTNGDHRAPYRSRPQPIFARDRYRSTRAGLHGLALRSPLGGFRGGATVARTEAPLLPGREETRRGAKSAVVGPLRRKCRCKRACGNSRIDHLASNFEKCQRLSIGVEVVSIDSRHGTAFFHKRFCVRPFEAELHAAEDAREKQLRIEANQLQINGMFRLGALQTDLAK